jgi:glucose-6-phosphate 1-dehydrogenase
MSALAKVPPGVGPKFPQIVVLVGATGDLSQRKLLPGLFHLCSAGFIPSCRIIGVSLDDIDVEGFRAIARGALDKFSPRKPGEADWAAFSATLDYVPMAAGPAALKAAVEKAKAAACIISACRPSQPCRRCGCWPKPA